MDLQDLKLKQLEFEQAVQRYAEAKAAQDKADLEAGTASDVARQRLVLLVPAVAAAGPDPVVKTMVLSVAVSLLVLAEPASSVPRCSTTPSGCRPTSKTASGSTSWPSSPTCSR